MKRKHFIEHVWPEVARGEARTVAVVCDDANDVCDQLIRAAAPSISVSDFRQRDKTACRGAIEAFFYCGVKWLVLPSSNWHELTPALIGAYPGLIAIAPSGAVGQALIDEFGPWDAVLVHRSPGSEVLISRRLRDATTDTLQEPR